MMKIRMLPLMAMVGIFSANPSFAMKEIDENEKLIPSSFQCPSPPQLKPLNPNELRTLLENANKGDEEAQKEFVNRYYWEYFNDKSTLFNNGLFNVNGVIDAVRSCVSWENMETRAIKDPQYAFLLIIAYARCEYDIRNGQSYLSKHLNNLPQFCKAIQEKATSGNPFDQFNLGLLYFHFGYVTTHPLGLGVQPQEIRNQAFEYFTKAANQGHHHANFTLGLSCYLGQHPRGGSIHEALRYFSRCKGTFAGQEGFKRCIPSFDLTNYYRKKREKQPQSLQRETTFQEELKDIKTQLGVLLGEHSLQVGIHHPEGKFSEHLFAIPELSTTYQKVAEVEEEALQIITSLQKTTPGFMINAFTIGQGNPEQIKRWVEGQRQPPFISIHDIDKMNYLTMGEENVLKATQFLTYVNEIEDKFSEAEIILQDDCESYKMRLKSSLAKLKEQRLLCLVSQKKAEKNSSEINQQNLKNDSQRFTDLQKKYEEKKLLLNPVVKKIETEINNLTEVKERIQTLIHKTSDKRNLDFLEENPFW